MFLDTVLVNAPVSLLTLHNTNKYNAAALSDFAAEHVNVIRIH